ncbi:MAG: hypothetical protein RL095_591 [Verrucomicrobiota bacterium]
MKSGALSIKVTGLPFGSWLRKVWKAQGKKRNAEEGMMTQDWQSGISIRKNSSNPNHHLWNNNGTWFIHYTLHPTALTKQRIRQSLNTKSVTEARLLRDAFFRKQEVKIFGKSKPPSKMNSCS